jgi:hypothetical protein
MGLDTIRIGPSSLLPRLSRPPRRLRVPSREGSGLHRTDISSDGADTSQFTNGSTQGRKDRRPDSSTLTHLPDPALRDSRRKLILSPAPIQIWTSMAWVEGCEANWTTPFRRRGRGVGYLLCPNQAAHPPTRISRPDSLTPRSIATSTTWEVWLLNQLLVMMNVGRVRWGLVWVIGGNGMMGPKTRVRTRWKLVSSRNFLYISFLFGDFFVVLLSSLADARIFFLVGVYAIPPYGR